MVVPASAAEMGRERATRRQSTGKGMLLFAMAAGGPAAVVSPVAAGVAVAAAVPKAQRPKRSAF